jgi:hypothetical protein
MTYDGRWDVNVNEQASTMVTGASRLGNELYRLELAFERYSCNVHGIVQAPCIKAISFTLKYWAHIPADLAQRPTATRFVITAHKRCVPLVVDPELE